MAERQSTAKWQTELEELERELERLEEALAPQLDHVRLRLDTIEEELGQMRRLFQVDLARLKGEP